MIVDRRFAHENLDNHDLFVHIAEEKFRPYIRCEYCVNADLNYEKSPKGYVYCTKYDMFSRIDKTCKSGVKKDQLEAEYE